MHNLMQMLQYLWMEGSVVEENKDDLLSSPADLWIGLVY